MNKITIFEPELQEYQRGEETRVRYRIRYKDLNGRWASKYSTDLDSAFKRYEEIKEALDMGVEIRKGISFQDCASQALAKRQMLIGKKNGLRRQTWDNDERHLRLHLTPHFGEMQMKAITTGVINDYIEEATVGLHAFCMSISSIHARPNAPLMTSHLRAHNTVLTTSNLPSHYPYP